MSRSPVPVQQRLWWNDVNARQGIIAASFTLVVTSIAACQTPGKQVSIETTLGEAPATQCVIMPTMAGAPVPTQITPEPSTRPSVQENAGPTTRPTK